MWKIYATFAFGIVAAAPSIDSALPPFDPSVGLSVVAANGDDKTQEQDTQAGRPEEVKTTTGKESRWRKASRSDADSGFCESPDERARAHCLIYMKLREHRS